MRRFITIVLVIFSCFLSELVLFDLFGNTFKPNLLVLLVVFFNVRVGISMSLFVAFFAGLLKDSYSAGVFGTYICAFVICAYVTSLIKIYFYQRGFRFSRIVLAFCISLLHGVSVYVINSQLGITIFPQSFGATLFPEVISTTFISFFAFKSLKQCVLKFSA